MKIIRLALPLLILTCLALAQEENVLSPLEPESIPVEIRAVLKPKIKTSGSFDPETGTLTFGIYSHGVDGFGLLDFGNIRIAFRGWKSDGECGGTYERPFIFPYERTSLTGARNGGQGAGTRRFSYRPIEEGGRVKRIEYSYAGTVFYLVDSYLEFERNGKLFRYRFTSGKLLLVIDEEKRLEAVYKVPNHDG
ncbi:MAG: hypothetical protein ACKV19_10785 [Verrucomicrobiales bacterium]